MKEIQIGLVHYDEVFIIITDPEPYGLLSAGRLLRLYKPNINNILTQQ